MTSLRNTQDLQSTDWRLQFLNRLFRSIVFPNEGKVMFNRRLQLLKAELWFKWFNSLLTYFERRGVSWSFLIEVSPFVLLFLWQVIELVELCVGAEKPNILNRAHNKGKSTKPQSRCFIPRLCGWNEFFSKRCKVDFFFRVTAISKKFATGNIPSHWRNWAFRLLSHFCKEAEGML